MALKIQGHDGYFKFHFIGYFIVLFYSVQCCMLNRRSLGGGGIQVSFTHSFDRDEYEFFSCCIKFYYVILLFVDCAK